MKKLTILFVIVLVAALASACQPDPANIAAAVEAAMPEPVEAPEAIAPPSAEEIAAALKALEAEEAAALAEEEAPAVVSDWCKDPFVIRTIDEGVAPVYQQKTDVNGKPVFITATLANKPVWAAVGDKLMVMVEIPQERAVNYLEIGKDGSAFWGFGGQTEVCLSSFHVVSSGRVFQLEGYKIPDGTVGSLGDIPYNIFVNFTDLIPAPAE